MATLNLKKSVTTAVQISSNVLAVASMFGLGVDDKKRLELVPPTELDLAPRRVVFITGPSGSGKSTLMQLIAEALRANPDEAAVIDFAALPALPDVALVDALGLPLDQALRLLSLAGLNDAFVMLRSAGQLSDGQRYRLRLAQAMAAVDHEAPLTVVLADEFGATLDRITAKVIAHNVRQWTSRAPVCFIAATTHDDLLEPLAPDCVIEQQLGSGLHIAYKERADADR